ncbi:uncharacterized protein VTP21DRAFT_1305 [Calcarisporiella thermophila]|uniref:uncharacterized protein n=1 Tax=Calcarisporiella thermophila TaxID=911321 RepID=UPI00374325E1
MRRDPSFLFPPLQQAEAFDSPSEAALDAMPDYFLPQSIAAESAAKNPDLSKLHKRYSSPAVLTSYASTSAATLAHEHPMHPSPPQHQDYAVGPEMNSLDILIAALEPRVDIRPEKNYFGVQKGDNIGTLSSQPISTASNDPGRPPIEANTLPSMMTSEPPFRRPLPSHSNPMQINFGDPSWRQFPPSQLAPAPSSYAPHQVSALPTILSPLERSHGQVPSSFVQHTGGRSESVIETSCEEGVYPNASMRLSWSQNQPEDDYSIYPTYHPNQAQEQAPAPGQDSAAVPRPYAYDPIRKRSFGDTFNDDRESGDLSMQARGSRRTKSLDWNMPSFMPPTVQHETPPPSPRDLRFGVPEFDVTPRRQSILYPDDRYTPRWVRFSGPMKEGYCDDCKPGRWLQLKNSAYWYHKQFYHGVSSVSKRPFTRPIEMRTLDGNVAEGLCHQCRRWIPIHNAKKRNDVLWYKHAHRCHVYMKPKSVGAAPRKQHRP